MRTARWLQLIARSVVIGSVSLTLPACASGPRPERFNGPIRAGGEQSLLLTRITSPEDEVRSPTIGVATLTINEQISFIDSNTASLTVNALHLRLLTGDEVIVSHAESLVDQCSAPLPAVSSTWSGVKARIR